MAPGAVALTRGFGKSMVRPGRGIAVFAALAVAVLTLGPVVAVLIRAGGWGSLGANEWQALRFTLMMGWMLQKIRSMREAVLKWCEVMF